ncbi:MAG TPA: hypothetical protein VKO87_12860 [Gemmatimonadaceae bacterium]|nr:hypothetical protein [Gemmatimonadaceae bacterium]
MPDGGDLNSTTSKKFPLHPAHWIRKSIAGYLLALALGGCFPANHRAAQDPAISSTIAPVDKGKTADRLLIVGLVLVAVGIILLLPRINDPNY